MQTFFGIQNVKENITTIISFVFSESPILCLLVPWPLGTFSLDMAAETKYGILKPLEFEQASGSNLAAYLYCLDDTNQQDARNSKL